MASLNSSLSMGSGPVDSETVTASDSKPSIDIRQEEDSGVNPAIHLAHPAFYYWIAAECILMRRTQFLQV
jgi:hypothetical protein